MKTRKLFFLTLFILALKIYSQNNEIYGVVTYVKSISAVSPKEKKFNLNFNKTHSFQEELTVEEDFNNRNKGASEKMKKIFNIGPNYEKKYFYYEKESDEFYFKTLIFSDYVVVKDELRFEWKLKNEFKEILGFKCQKAISRISFRGRKYEAWFTPEIPVTFGPWKVNGLPGLILEFADLDRLIYYKAFKIDLKNTALVNFENIKEKILKENPLTIAKYVEAEKNNRKEFFSRLESKLPKGMGKISSYDITRVEIFENQE